MNFSFGIITKGDNDNFLIEMINSIIIQDIPEYEIIIVGNTQILKNNLIPNSIPIQFIDFDETLKNNWITRKKNICCELSKYENVVLLHDYVKLEKDWYSGFCKFGNNFNICITPIETIDNKRFRDYNIFAPWMSPHFDDGSLLPYDFEMTEGINKISYISGTYYIIKKNIALLYPLNETLCWGNGEDLELASRLSKDNILIKCNKYSKVKLLKNKYQCPFENEISEEKMKLLHLLTS